MEIMYLKYGNGKRHCIIKEGENIIVNNSKVIPFNSVKKLKENEYAPYSDNKKNYNNCNLDNKIDQEITNFFFNAIHKNYLSNRKK